jgi:hypothetical protein
MSVLRPFGFKTDSKSRYGDFWGVGLALTSITGQRDAQAHILSRHRINPVGM